jgi:hypothetical protein
MRSSIHKLHHPELAPVLDTINLLTSAHYDLQLNETGVQIQG